jgi:hypothetical protein
MACPYFLPETLMDADHSGFRALVPLGDLYAGRCMARELPFSPDEQFQRDFCNFGYARSTCGRFSCPESADAVRFSVAADEGNCVRICFARERNHLPHSHGTLEFSQDGGVWTGNTPDPMLLGQAKSYLMSYLRRRPRIE